MFPRKAACLVVLALASGCAGVRKVNIFTVPQEMAVGEIFASQVDAAYPILDDPRISWYLNHRGRVLAQLSARSDLPYTFAAIDTPELNAFAIPGGHAYFNLGMIEAADTESELLGVMAHEIGHVVAQHGMKQMSTQTLVGIGATAALAQYPNQWAYLAANLFSETGFLKMSRDDERDADTIGFELVVKAGYDPQGMVDLFEKLVKLRDKEPRLLDKLFSTHPPTPERIARIKGFIAAAKLPPDLKRDSDAFRELHDYVLKTYYVESYRRRWQEYLKQKDKKDQGDEDRLPWDHRKPKHDKKDKQGQEKGGKDKAPSATPAPTPAPTPALEPAPAPEATPAATPVPGSGGG